VSGRVAEGETGESVMTQIMDQDRQRRKQEPMVARRERTGRPAGVTVVPQPRTAHPTHAANRRRQHEAQTNRTGEHRDDRAIDCVEGTRVSD
jgi:hypothetical protein